MRLYADADKIETWMGKATELDTTPLLRRASTLVADACRNDIYRTDSDGYPADPALSDAMSDATCAQIETWIAGGYDVIAGPGGQEPRSVASGIDGASVSFDLALTNEARDRAMTGLCQESYSLLRNAGLASALVV